MYPITPVTTTHRLPPAGEQLAQQRTRPKREQVLVACKACRARNTKCSGERPHCRQCETREQLCEWEILSDEAPRASRRKYQDLEQRSANEHELLNHFRVLSESDCLGLMRRLRDGCSIKDLLIAARESSSVSYDDQSSEDVLMTTQEPDMTYRPLETSLHAGVDPGSNQNVGEIRVASRPTLPPISSIWQPHYDPFSSSSSPTLPTPNVTPPDEDTGRKSNPRYEKASLYDRWINQN